MSWAIVGSLAAGVIGAGMSADAASEAASTQAAASAAASKASLQATRESNQLTADIYRQNLSNLNPNLVSGQTALSALQSAMGLGPARAGLPGTGPGSANTGMRTGTTTNAAGQIVDQQGNVVTDYGIGNIQTGATQDELSSAAGVYQNALTGEFTGQDIYTDPSYQFRLSEGMRNLRAQQAAGGNRYSGQSMKDITNYAQGAASQEYGSAYDRYMRNKQALYDRLSNMAGLSAGAASGMNAAGTSAASNIGATTSAGVNASNQALLGGASAIAAGQVGSTNAIVSGVNNAANNYVMMDYLRNQNRPNPVPAGLSGPSNAQLAAQLGIG